MRLREASETNGSKSAALRYRPSSRFRDEDHIVFNPASLRWVVSGSVGGMRMDGVN